jgi:hypothetical protein
MNTLDLATLDNVTGGAIRASSTSNDAITQSLTSLQTTVSQLANNNNNNNSSSSSQSNLLLPMAMMFAMNRRQPTIVSGGATVVG